MIADALDLFRAGRLQKARHMPVSSVHALRRGLGFCLLLLALAPWAVSAHDSVQTGVLFPKLRSWQSGRQGWFGGLATGLTLFADATVWGPGGELSLDLNPGTLMVGIVGYDLGALRFGQEVAWHRAPMNAVSANGTDTRVTGEISQLKLLSRNRLALRLTPGSPHAAYVSLGLGALKATIKFAHRTAGSEYDESRWAFVYEMQAGLVCKFANDERLRIGIRTATAEPHKRVFFDSWFNFRLSRGSPHRAYVGGSLGAVDSNAEEWLAGYQAGAGMVFEIAQRTVLGVDYRYVAMPSFSAHTPGTSLRYNF